MGEKDWLFMLVRELIDLVELDYEVEGRATLKDLRYCRKHLDAAFGDLSVEDITMTQVQRFKLARRQSGAAEATVNKDLNWLGRGYTLAVLGRFLRSDQVPQITRYKIGHRNVRHELVELRDFELLQNELCGVVRDLVRFLYYSGWRFGEPSALSWDHVHESEIVLPACETKEAKLTTAALSRVLPLEGEIKEVIGRRLAARRGEWVFHRRGQRIRSIRTAWTNALERGGVKHMGLHALRKGFCKNGIEAGVDRDVLMEFTGHRCDETFRRYNLVNQRRKREAMEKMGKFAQGERA